MRWGVTNVPWISRSFPEKVGHSEGCPNLVGGRVEREGEEESEGVG